MDNKFNLPGIPISLLHLSEPVKCGPNSSLEIVKVVSKWCDEGQQGKNLLSLLLLRECPAQFNIRKSIKTFIKICHLKVSSGMIGCRLVTLAETISLWKYVAC